MPFSKMLPYSAVSGQKVPGGGHSELPLGLEVVSDQPLSVYAFRSDSRFTGAFSVPALTNDSNEFFIAGWMSVSHTELYSPINGSK